MPLVSGSGPTLLRQTPNVLRYVMTAARPSRRVVVGGSRLLQGAGLLNKLSKCKVT